jgi:hypothetical protein
MLSLHDTQLSPKIFLTRDQMWTIIALLGHCGPKSFSEISMAKTLNS